MIRRPAFDTMEKLYFHQDDGPAHTARYTSSWPNFKEENIVAWLSYSPDLNPIENLWTIIKGEIITTENQLSSLADL